MTEPARWGERSHDQGLHWQKGALRCRITPPGGEAMELAVESFVGREGISQPFEYEAVLFESAKPQRPARFDWTNVCGGRADLTLQPAGRPEELPLVNGFISRFQIERREGGPWFRVRLVPAVWVLSQGRSWRIFQDQRADEIVGELLRSAQIPHLIRCTANEQPRRRPYCVQYGESDWSFICRLLEEEGFSYFFTHQRGQHLLQITDHPRQLTIAPPTTIPYVPPSGMVTTGDHVTHFAVSSAVTPTSYVARDQIFDRPWLLDTAEDSVLGKTPIEVYEYVGEPKVKETSALPSLRLQELQTPARVLHGRSDCVRLTSSHTFALGLPDSTDDWLITEVEHRAVRKADESEGAGYGYGNTFSAVPAEVHYRPPRRTQRPTVPGIQSAQVVGPEGEEVYTDELGRVKVQFPWDRRGKLDERSSCWVPVAQLWAGPSWGTLFIPRVGQQVLVGFVDGDPDQPIIVGQAYHSRNRPPGVLPDNKTVSTIKTSSSPSSREPGSNEIRFEDKAGAEELYLHAQRDRKDVVRHDQAVTVGHDAHREIGNVYREDIGCSYVQEVGRATKEQAMVREVTILGDERESVTGKSDHHLAGPSSVTVDGARIHLFGALREEIKGVSKTTVKRGDSIRVLEEGDAREEILKGGYKLDVKEGECAVRSRGSMTHHSDKAVVHTSPVVQLRAGEKVEIVGDGEVEVSGKTISIAAGQEVKIGVGANTITLSANGIEVGGTKITSAAIGQHEITGAMVKIN